MTSAALPSLHATPNPRCVACGRENANGLHITYRVEASGSAAAEWAPTAAWESFPGVIHGGIVATALDEAMSQAVIASGCEALTAELRVRYHRHIAPGERLHIRGWIVSRAKRLIATEAAVTAPDGSERAHAWASFLTLPARKKAE